ncbi:MAG TPA: hypothetical protein VFO19_17530 [Vicinamibacterales bacterium]|nr:hypothetical protein [Vicinamibacterales bacterium]
MFAFFVALPSVALAMAGLRAIAADDFTLFTAFTEISELRSAPIVRNVRQRAASKILVADLSSGRTASASLIIGL